MSTSNHRAGHLIAAAILPAILFAASAQLSFADDYVAQASPASASPNSAGQPAAAARLGRVEARITELHKQLRITADQEPLWGNVAQVMRDNEQRMHDRITARAAKQKTMTAVDDLRSYRMIADEHADGLKRLVPAFEALYAQMTPAQQKHADHVFGEHQKHATHRG
jgi:hypothetical protein